MKLFLALWVILQVVVCLFIFFQMLLTTPPQGGPGKNRLTKHWEAGVKQVFVGFTVIAFAMAIVGTLIIKAIIYFA